jgi:hypothetical protein
MAFFSKERIWRGIYEAHDNQGKPIRGLLTLSFFQPSSFSSAPPVTKWHLYIDGVLIQEFGRDTYFFEQCGASLRMKAKLPESPNWVYIQYGIYGGDDHYCNLWVTTKDPEPIVYGMWGRQAEGPGDPPYKNFDFENWQHELGAVEVKMQMP